MPRRFLQFNDAVATVDSKTIDGGGKTILVAGPGSKLEQEVLDGGI